MATTLAHELSQPLTTILNYAGASQAMLEQGAGLHEIGPVIAEIGKGAARAGDLIRSVRAMTGRGDVKREPFNPNEVIEAAVILAEIGACAGVTLECNLAGGPMVTGDPIQIQQVLFNLVRNACEAAQGSHKEQVIVSSSTTEENVVITVEDSGPGIAPEHLKSLFEAFFSTKADGMGVGLSISRTIIDAHQGKMWAENRPEGGARLSISLPIADLNSGDVSELVEAE